MYLYISVLGYFKEHLHQFGNKTPIKPYNQPYPSPEQTYGADDHKMKPLDMSP